MLTIFGFSLACIAGAPDDAPPSTSDPAPQATATKAAFDVPVKLAEGCDDLGIAKLVAQDTENGEMESVNVYILPADAGCTDFDRALMTTSTAAMSFVGTHQHHVVVNLSGYGTTNHVYDLLTGKEIVSNAEILAQVGPGMKVSLDGGVLKVSGVDFANSEECGGGLAALSECARKLSAKSDIDISGVTPSCTGAAREAIESGGLDYPLTASVQIDLPAAKRTATALECYVPQ